ncbi:protein LURP-one-related 15-like [Vicia villosa]|uniref:protein LURP-one-related 15-like n=1 Tax=Vicia villosa TaxID=3911 RepID=UPI00273CE218|nr:protein LURP-one-related 15-like [Vicia villosa]
MENQPQLSATAVISPQYCAPATHPVDLIIIKERTRGRHNFTVTDINNNIIFTVKSPLVSIVTPRQHRFLYDANGNPILHLRRSLLAADDKWKAYRGESEEPQDLIFTRERSSLMPLRTKLNVYLANNSTQDCDFTVKANLSQLSWKVYLGNSDNFVAQIEKQRGSMFNREKFMVTVSPNMDYAFIVALVVTFD